MKEIGSEFWDVPVQRSENGLFPDSVQWFLSGRAALQSVLGELRGRRTAALPSWCCDSMIRPFLDTGLDVRFYPVYWRDRLVQDIRLDCDILLLMDYFGYAAPPPDLSGFQGVVLRDVTHSVFTRPGADRAVTAVQPDADRDFTAIQPDADRAVTAVHTDGDYAFGSLRKWCGLWTGGFAWARDGRPLPVEAPEGGPVEASGGQGYSREYVRLRARAMEYKACYLTGRPDREGRTVTDKGYLNLFREAEECLDTVGAASADPRDIDLARRLDVQAVRERRRKNAEILRRAFPDWLLFPDWTDADCPLFVPVLVPDGRRDALRAHLIQQDIYCPVHWPVSPYHHLDTRERFLYDNELSFVCDQRYTERDMDRIVEAVNGFMGG